jgi:hypothetical protein
MGEESRSGVAPLFSFENAGLDFLRRSEDGGVFNRATTQNFPPAARNDSQVTGLFS